MGERIDERMDIVVALAFSAAAPFGADRPMPGPERRCHVGRRGKGRGRLPDEPVTRPGGMLPDHTRR